MQAFSRTCEDAGATESSEYGIRACDEITQAVTFCVVLHLCSDTHTLYLTHI